jgi:hypothetical protein
MKYIIDTNVPVNAGKTNQQTELDARCSLKCLQFIQHIMTNNQAIILLDWNGDILKEYNRNINIHGNRTIATQFLAWILRNITLADGGRIEQKFLDKRGVNDYVDFPADPNLDGFDPPDRKFVALSSSYHGEPTIVQGSDSLWWRYRDILAANGIRVRFLCEEYMIAKNG